MSDPLQVADFDAGLSCFVVPDVDLPFSSTPVREDAEELCQRAIAWGLRFGLIGKRGAARLEATALLGLGVALTGTAALERAEVLMAWFLWALTLDDRIDDGPWAENGALERFVVLVEGVVAGGREAGAADPMLVALAEDLWPRSCALGGSRWQERLRRCLLRHLRAQRELVRLRQASERLGERDYIGLRRDSFGALFFFALMDGADGVDESEHWCATGCVDALRDHAANVIAWTNDLCSVVKDAVCGEQYNLVAVFAEAHGLKQQAAAEAVRELVMAAVGDFVAVAERHRAHTAVPPSSGTDAATRLTRVMRASGDWHRAVSRYHLQPDSARRAEPGRTGARRVPPTLKSRQFETDPYPLYARLRSAMPVAYDEPADVWLLSRHADVKAALTDPRASSENYDWQIGPLLGRNLVAMGGREHTAHRALLTPSFRGRAMEVLLRSIDDVVSRLVDGFARRAQVDLIAEFTSVLPIQVMARALGLQAETSEQVRRLKTWCSVGFAYLGNYRQDPGLLTGGLASRDEFYSYLQPTIDARRADPRDDLISALLAASVDGEELSDEYVRSTCAVLMTAGSESTHGALANVIVNVVDEPGVQAAVVDDPALLDNALAETLRRNPPMQLVLRQTKAILDLPSGTVPADATVACLIGSANRDPDRFDRPDEFDLYRTDCLDREYSAAASHYAFGAGRHHCLGSHLARAEIAVGLRMLLDAFPDIRWAYGFRPVETGFLNRCPSRLEVAL